MSEGNRSRVARIQAKRLWVRHAKAGLVAVIASLGSHDGRAQQDTATTLIFVYIPEQIRVEFSTNLNLRTFFRTARYDEENNAFFGGICVSGSAEAQLSFASFTTEQAFTLQYGERAIEAVARFLNGFQSGNTTDTVVAIGDDATGLCPNGAEPIQLGVYLAMDFRDFDSNLLSGTLELFVRPI